MDKESLTEVFAKLGAKNPEIWAKSQIEEGIPQLARFVFLKKAWSLVVSESEFDWIDSCLNANPSDPVGNMVESLNNILSSGIDKRDIATIVRVMQWRLLASICYLLDDPGEEIVAGEDIAWRLFQVDGQDFPIVAMAGLHESVLEVEPSGTEMGHQASGRHV